MPGTVGERIVEVRRARGWTQAQLAAELQLSSSYVSLIESGRRLPRSRLLAELARALGCSADYLRTGRDGDATENLELDLRFAELALRSGDVPTARAQFADVLTRAERLGELHREAADEALWGLSRAHVALGRVDAALRGLETLDRRPALPPAVSRTAVRMCLCRAYLECGDLGRAIDVGEAALRELDPDGSGFVSEEATELASTLVLCYHERGDLTRARLLVESAIAGAERSGSMRARAAAYWNAALVAATNGEVRHARSLTERALALYGEVGNAWAVASLRVNSAALLLQLPEPREDQAAALLERALAELPAAGAPAADIAAAETELARCRLVGGDAAAAVEIARTALARVTDGPQLEAARARAVLADALLAVGEDDEAVTAYAEAAGGFERVGATRQASQAWSRLADALLRLGRTDEAITAYRRLADAAGAQGHRTAPAGMATGAREQVHWWRPLSASAAADAARRRRVG